MRGFLAAFVMSALVLSTSQVAGSERPPSRPAVQSAAAIQMRVSDRTPSNRKNGGKRQFSATTDFRAEDLIPDICKGCSS